MTQELEGKRFSIVRLRRLVFGARTEKLRNLEGGDKSAGDAESDEPGTTPEPGDSPDDSNNNDSQDSSEQSPTTDKPKRKAKGHGRHGAEDYTGAMQRHVPVLATIIIRYYYYSGHPSVVMMEPVQYRKCDDLSSTVGGRDVSS